MKFPLIRMLVWDERCQDRGSAIPIPTGIPEGIKVGNELPDSVFNPEVGKTETLWKSSA